MTLRRPSGRKIQICSLRMMRRRHPRNLLSRIHSNCHPQLDWGSSVYLFFFVISDPNKNPIFYFPSLLKKKYFLDSRFRGNDHHCYPRKHTHCHPQLDWGSSVYFFSFSLLFPIQTRIQFFIYFIFLRK